MFNWGLETYKNMLIRAGAFTFHFLGLILFFIDYIIMKELD
jgi:hypothetical protein